MPLNKEPNLFNEVSIFLGEVRPLVVILVVTAINLFWKFKSLCLYSLLKRLTMFCFLFLFFNPVAYLRPNRRVSILLHSIYSTILRNIGLTSVSMLNAYEFDIRLRNLNFDRQLPSFHVVSSKRRAKMVASLVLLLYSL